MLILEIGTYHPLLVPVEEYIDSELLQNSDPYYIDQINPYTGKSFRQGFFDYKMQTD
jgi:hypothetical protein